MAARRAVRVLDQHAVALRSGGQRRKAHRVSQIHAQAGHRHLAGVGGDRHALLVETAVVGVLLGAHVHVVGVSVLVDQWTVHVGGARQRAQVVLDARQRAEAALVDVAVGCAAGCLRVATAGLAADAARQRRGGVLRAGSTGAGGAHLRGEATRRTEGAVRGARRREAAGRTAQARLCGTTLGVLHRDAPQLSLAERARLSVDRLLALMVVPA
mmetsp:Transcript_15977/g.40981  ORF Transcript_15977/g.40981 Transcript_15977/m.40981 type:complete len:213 (-) Transcript_15977:723-1361(-)